MVRGIVRVNSVYRLNIIISHRNKLCVCTRWSLKRFSSKEFIIKISFNFHHQLAHLILWYFPTWKSSVAWSYCTLIFSFFFFLSLLSCVCVSLSIFELTPHILFKVPHWLRLFDAGTEVTQREVKKEPQSNFFGSHFDQSSSCSKAGLMSVSLTLNRAAAEVPFFYFIIFLYKVINISPSQLFWSCEAYHSVA